VFRGEVALSILVGRLVGKVLYDVAERVGVALCGIKSVLG